jgi:hypothetical protein
MIPSSAVIFLGYGAGNPIPDARTKQYYDARPCASLVESAAQILDEMIESMDNKA